MNTSDKPIDEADLQAYVDDRLEPQRRAEVEFYLANHSDAAAKVLAYQRQNELLRQLYADVNQEPIPRRLLVIPKTRHKLKRIFRTTAYAASLLLSGFLGWQIHVELTPKPLDIAFPLVQQAITAHAVYSPEIRHPVEVGADQESHMLQWLSKRIGVAIHAPDLTNEGFRLIGGRLLPANDGPAALIMYENENGKRITLYMRTTPTQQGITAFHFERRGNTGAFYWMDANLGYAITGEMDKAELLNIAHRVHQALNT